MAAATGSGGSLVQEVIPPAPLRLRTVNPRLPARRHWDGVQLTPPGRNVSSILIGMAQRRTFYSESWESTPMHSWILQNGASRIVLLGFGSRASAFGCVFMTSNTDLSIAK